MNRIMRYMSPMGFCQPEDLASLYAYVASDEAHYMTGSIVTMDGGITL
jgi:3-oxoacyl-[acyl-carrier protein] reductase